MIIINCISKIYIIIDGKGNGKVRVEEKKPHCSISQARLDLLGGTVLGWYCNL